MNFENENENENVSCRQHDRSITARITKTFDFQTDEWLRLNFDFEIDLDFWRREVERPRTA
jgi:hypothetical protein